MWRLVPLAIYMQEKKKKKGRKEHKRGQCHTRENMGKDFKWGVFKL